MIDGFTSQQQCMAHHSTAVGYGYDMGQQRFCGDGGRHDAGPSVQPASSPIHTAAYIEPTHAPITTAARNLQERRCWGPGSSKQDQASNVTHQLVFGYSPRQQQHLVSIHPPSSPASQSRRTMDSGHNYYILDAQYDFFGKRLATCSADHSICIWDQQPPLEGVS